jgi:glycerophosphoryl diester phosphodiesterase
MPVPIQIIAHRGYSARAPENTVAALEAAIEAGADAVEFDVHTAACGTPVLFHDATLSRTTDGVGPLRRRTFVQLRALDAGGWFSKRFAGERIPSLREGLEVVRNRVELAYVEVKGYRELEDLDRMVHIARDLAMLGQVMFISMNWTALARMRGQEELLRIGYVVEEEGRIEEAFQSARGDPNALLDLKADFVLAQPGLVERALEQGTDLAVWTVDDTEHADLLREHGIRRITTNEVERLLEWRQAGS